MDLIERLREHATDWNGEQMPDLEPAKGDPTAGLMREAADALSAARDEVERLREALSAIDRHVSHGKMGDWAIALDEIRKLARTALSSMQEGGERG